MNKEFDTLISIIIYKKQLIFNSLIILLKEEAVRKRIKALKDVILEENYIAFAAITNIRRKKEYWYYKRAKYKKYECLELEQATKASTKPLQTPKERKGLSPKSTKEIAQKAEEVF